MADELGHCYGGGDVRENGGGWSVSFTGVEKLALLFYAFFSLPGKLVQAVEHRAAEKAGCADEYHCQYQCCMVPRP